MKRGFFAFVGATLFWAVVAVIALVMGVYAVLWIMLGGPGVFNAGHGTVTISSTAQPQYDYQTPHP